MFSQGEKMSLDKEIRKIVEYRNAMLAKHVRKRKDALEIIIDGIYELYLAKRYDFSQFTNITLKQDNKIRNVKLYEPFSMWQKQE